MALKQVTARADFRKSAVKEVPYIKYAYAMPIITHFKKRGICHYFSRNENGILLFEGREAARSLTANKTVIYPALAEKPDKIKYIEFKGGEGSKVRIPF